jgi:hypothetical protein
MEALLALLVASGCIGLSLSLYHRRRHGARSHQATEVEPTRRIPQSPPPERGLDHLELADVLLFDGADLLVVGLARFSEGASSWVECLIDHDGQERWLVLRDDDPDFLRLGQPVSDPGFGGHPSEAIELEGQIFDLQRRGQVTISSQGRFLDAPPLTQAQYWDYRRPGSDRLWVRSVGETWIFVRGQQIKRHLVTFLPGS